MRQKETLKWRLAQWAEIKWWKRYLNHKSPESYLKWKRKYWETLLADNRDCIDMPPKPPILDAGCGPAGIFMVFDNMKTTAIDPLLENYSNLPHFNPSMYPNVEFIVSDIEHFKSHIKYNTVFCTNALNHVNNLQMALYALDGNTAKGAHLYFTVDTHRWWMTKWFFRFLPFDLLHPHQLGLKDYAEILDLQGFCVEQKKLIKKGMVFNYFLLVCSK